MVTLLGLEFFSGRQLGLQITLKHSSSSFENPHSAHDISRNGRETLRHLQSGMYLNIIWVAPEIVPAYSASLCTAGVSYTLQTSGQEAEASIHIMLLCA